MLTCENELSNINTTDKQILSVTCHSNGSWIPDPADFIKSCSSFTTVPPGIVHSVQMRIVGLCFVRIKPDFYANDDVVTFRCTVYYIVSSTAEISSRTSIVPTGTANLIAVISSTLIIMCAVSSIVFLVIGYACGRFGHKGKQSHTSKATSDPAKKSACRSEPPQLPQTPGPLYEELQLQPNSTLEYQDLVELKENVAYGPVAK